MNIQEHKLEVLYHLIQLSKGGYTTEELNAAFKTVANKEHWKGAINAVVENPSPEHQNLLDHAVRYYTGSAPRFSITSGGNLHVQAAGYWATIGA